MNNFHSYHEHLLHWLWQNRYLQNHKLRTQKGKEVTIYHPGYPNPSDGPDFLNARISIGRLKWHGDVEIHWSSEDWNSHGHQNDANYNRVILHVIFETGPQAPPVQRLDNTVLPTLCMKPFLSESLRYFFHHYRQPESLPCAGNIPTIPQKVFRAQFEEAHAEYFEEKVNDLLKFYDAGLPLSKAWPYMLTVALFDGLGISHNRQPMQKLARILLKEIQNIPSETELLTTALRITGIDPKNKKNSFNWKRKGSRPSNHPEVRIRQACKIFWFIKKASFRQWMHTEVKKAFDALLQSVDTEPGLGRHRSGILYGTIWLPAYYLLGNFTGAKQLASKAQETWTNYRTKLPVSITKKFQEVEIPPEIFRKKLGTVHQYRSYCRPHQCGQCKVFEHVISS